MQRVAHVENLRLKFTGGGESLLFKDLSTSFFKGEKVLLLGPSGCGKSTLLQVLSGLIPHSIEVPMKAEQLEIPSSWGYVFQDPDTQFCMPFVDEEIAFVLENLLVPREDMKEMIQELLDQVGLDVPDLHTNIHTLSGGMKQRLAIASVLALKPDVLFLDEPTAMLDPEGTEQIWETIKRVGTDKTLIIVEHKLDHVIDFVERIVLFNDQGQIIADGPKDMILKSYTKEFIEQGIWYPGVWEHYLERNPVFRDRVNHKHEIISLHDLEGYHRKEPKITIPDAQIGKGEWITIVGKNGAGKSTLLHSLMQLIPTKGTYLVNKTPINKIKKLTDVLTFVFQNPEFQFVTNSVYDEIAYSLRLRKMKDEDIKSLVEPMLQTFNLVKVQSQHPYQLSMGQKRRLSVAAAIINKQDVLLLDEPTFGQDSKNTFALLELLEKQRLKGTTILMVTHSEEIVEHFATRIWTIDNGRLIADQFTQPLENSIMEEAK